ncbi:metallophosphoesterase family protein [Erythrobacter ani]|uniref:Serine/threonine protein phosphatase n=1 Tax=Erythrobacter ani TaxID=2827235 RepID=A0ABS6SIY0_9SPHN|nr:metallophosphoesterase family protein [Erythrobacter ani]MBV7264960.1 serine/threonine protein phosphatase [Erythrobacter ani]
MFEIIRSFFRSRSEPLSPSVPDGTRFYVIGDIHGRLDLYEALIEAIERDDAQSGPADTHIILLGDLVDRGPDSAGVIARTREWQSRRNVRVLLGNHEEMFLESFENPEILRHFLKHGGRETIISYGLSKKQLNEMSLDDLFEKLPEIVSPAERDYIANLDEKIVAGDYLFVHAGIDPAFRIEDQQRSDMLWIRDRFLEHEAPFEKVVVHGHTIFDDVVNHGNRIGIDTGAFRSGVLTALVLEDDRMRTLQTRVDGDAIAIVSNNTAL